MVQRFAGDWVHLTAAGYGDMYGLLTAKTRQAITRADFVLRYQAVADRMYLERITVQPGAPQGTGSTMTVPLTVHFFTRYAGSFGRTIQLKVAGQGDVWAIEWGAEAILPELAGDRHLRESHQLPPRGRILARDGTELATNDDHGVQVGVVTGQIRDEAAMLQSLTGLLGMKAADLKARYAGGQPDWFMPIRTLPPDTPAVLHDQLAAIPGVDVRLATVRFYPHHAMAAQLIGYVSADGTAQAGLEKSLDSVLAGTPGGRLWVVDNAEHEVAQVAVQQSQPGLDVILAIDAKVQATAETALNVDPRDAAVVEDPRTGEVLAMASHPAFDPNAFAFGLGDQIAAINATAGSPPYWTARPAASIPRARPSSRSLRWPPCARGSSRPTNRSPCPHHWEGYGPPGQDNHETADLGPIDLSTAIARSCNTYFYEVGKRLNDRNRKLLPDTARSFGLGMAAGLLYVAEEPGKVPDPLLPGDATNLAIGQGGLLVTPLQMADFASALSNGGNVPRPRVVLRFQDATGRVVRSFDAATAGKANVRAADLPVLLNAMRRVAADPVGTMYVVFHASQVQFYGKSGTAETTSGNPDVWFIGGAPLAAPAVVASVVVEEKPNGLHAIDAAQAAREVILAGLGSSR